MRFKEIQKSAYHKQTHQLEIQRLQTRLQEIKKSKTKLTTVNHDKQNFLPRITKRHQSIDIIRQKQIELENSRLIKKLQETKVSNSRYLKEVIKVETQRVTKRIKNKGKKTQKMKLLHPTQNGIQERDIDIKL